MAEALPLREGRPIFVHHRNRRNVERLVLEKDTFTRLVPETKGTLIVGSDTHYIIPLVKPLFIVTSAAEYDNLAYKCYWHKACLRSSQGERVPGIPEERQGKRFYTLIEYDRLKLIGTTR